MARMNFFESWLQRSVRVRQGNVGRQKYFIASKQFGEFQISANLSSIICKVTLSCLASLLVNHMCVQSKSSSVCLQTCFPCETEDSWKLRSFFKVFLRGHRDCSSQDGSGASFHGWGLHDRMSWKAPGQPLQMQGRLESFGKHQEANLKSSSRGPWQSSPGGGGKHSPRPPFPTQNVQKHHKEDESP